MHSLQKHYLLLLAVCLVLLCLPRLNRDDIGGLKNFTGKGEYHQSISNIGNVPVDVDQYIKYVEYFRKQIPAESLIAPFSYRPLVPLLASFIPMNPMMSINSINILSLLIGLFYLIRILAELGFNARLQLAGGIFYVFSFPIFYYGAIGYIDPVSLCLILVAIFYLLRKNYWGLAITILIGVFTKESIFLILPFIFGSIAIYRKSVKSRLQTGIILFIIF